MQCYRTREKGEVRLLVVQSGSVYDLTSTNGSPRGFGDVAELASKEGTSVEAFVESRIPNAEFTGRSDVGENAIVPVVAEEVWAAGVTYQISEAARKSESGMPEVYVDVYESDRPELFLKATPSRTVGPNEAVGIRGDSDWNVPEPELGFVLYDGEIVGYTIGNDVSSREIEGASPLYLPQAKVYKRCCAIGPCVVPATVITDWDDLEIRMRIKRDGNVVYDEATSTAEMVRSPSELASYLIRHNTIPKTTVLLTGTSLVPDEDYTLKPTDVVEIDIQEIGCLRNPVTVV